MDETEANVGTLNRIGHLVEPGDTVDAGDTVEAGMDTVSEVFDGRKVGKAKRHCCCGTGKETVVGIRDTVADVRGTVVDGGDIVNLGATGGSGMAGWCRPGAWTRAGWTLNLEFFQTFDLSVRTLSVGFASPKTSNRPSDSVPICQSTIESLRRHRRTARMVRAASKADDARADRRDSVSDARRTAKQELE